MFAFLSKRYAGMRAFVGSLSLRELWALVTNTPARILIWNLMLSNNMNDEVFGSSDGVAVGKEIPADLIAYEDGKPVNIRELSMGKTIVLNFGSCT